MTERPTRAEIDLAALRHNFAQVRRQVGPECGVLAVVKADAYGHGAIPVARTLELEGAAAFAVALVEEGMALRRAGLRRPILVFGAILPGQEAALFDFDLTPYLFDLETARRLDQAARERGTVLAVQLKIDTGMGRIGVLPEELGGVLGVLATLSGLRLEGVMSHLALADESQSPLNAAQQQVFRQALEQVRAAGFAPRWIHISNSAAIFSLATPECNLVRPGIVLYGGLPAPELAGRLELRPVMNLRSRIVQLKALPVGAGVSYGHHFHARRPSLIATVPIGYADGYNRLLSNCGEALVRGVRVRVAGRVCMDWTLFDVTEVPGVALGDEITLLGGALGGTITGDEWAGRIGTIAYEVFCGIGKRVPRVHLGGL
jgi:alanine racemase